MTTFEDDGRTANYRLGEEHLLPSARGKSWKKLTLQDTVLTTQQQNMALYVDIVIKGHTKVLKDRDGSGPPPLLDAQDRTIGLRQKYEAVRSLFVDGDPLSQVSSEYIRGVLDLAGRLWATEAAPASFIKEVFMDQLVAEFGPLRRDEEESRRRVTALNHGGG